MSLYPQRTVSELKELRELTADEGVDARELGDRGDGGEIPLLRDGSWQI